LQSYIYRSNKPESFKYQNFLKQKIEMSQFTRIQVVTKMAETGMVPLFYNSNADIVCKTVAACYEGGARLFEITNRGDFAHEVFRDVMKFASKNMPEMIVGAGSIVDAPTAAIYMQMGAGFIVSPILNQEIAKVCNRRKTLWIAGCASLSEISQAEEWGAEIVKLFPANQTIGPDFIKAIKGPMPWSSILPTGGIKPTEESIKPWIQAGALCVGLGSELITKSIIADGNFTKLSDDVAAVLSLIKKIR
jgi:2-dehydro-3-deoxyphosphogluconate aldolase/(4S)-4-hydroxy-2-oxoglutarate aldolase